MTDVAEKLAYFQAITGVEDTELCTEILSVHGWDLEQAISSFTSTPNDNQVTLPSDVTDVGDVGTSDRFDRQQTGLVAPEGVDGTGQPGLAWKLITLPISILSGSVGLVSGAIGLGFWVAGSVLSYSISMIGLNSGRNGGSSSSLL